MKKTQKIMVAKKRNSKVISYRLKGIKTSNGLSHFVPKEKSTLV
jgi:hypothetical protein